MASLCGSCGREVVWVLTEGGKRMPLDPEPRVDGNLEFTGRIIRTDRGGTREVRSVKPQAELFADATSCERYVTHFATCPNADRHRKAPEPKVDPDEVGGARAQANHPETAHAAARVVKRGSQHAAILLDLRDAPRGRTAYELATLAGHLTTARPGISPNQAASRLHELRERGLVEPLVENGMVVRRRAAVSDAEVQVLTLQGKAEALRLALAEAER